MRMSIYAREYLDHPHLAVVFDDEGYVYADRVDRPSAERIAELYRSTSSPHLQTSVRSILAKKEWRWADKTYAILELFPGEPRV